MGKKKDLIKKILGFETPSAIQQRAIKPILAGHDTIAQAQSGTQYVKKTSIHTNKNNNNNNKEREKLLRLQSVLFKS